MKIGRFLFFKMMPLHANSKSGFYRLRFNHETTVIGFRFPFSRLDIRMTWK